MLWEQIFVCLLGFIHECLGVLGREGIFQYEWDLSFIHVKKNCLLFCWLLNDSKCVFLTEFGILETNITSFNPIGFFVSPLILIAYCLTYEPYGRTPVFQINRSPLDDWFCGCKLSQI